ncbi:MAG TPA: NDP-sugar synthase [Acidimicrobiales bacterium]|nr:NDP-sugar synthase [Acidimicrobiales bacterium]
MKAVVLVGGEGTRLRPLTLTTPKQMLPVGGRAMIERVLGWLAGHGIDEAVLSLGYRPDAFLKAYPDGECAGVRLHYAVEDSPLDTAGAIRFAAVEGGVSETFVVVNGDVLTGLDVTALVRFHRDRGAEATIALTPVEDPSAFGVVPTREDGQVTAFIEKPPRDQAPTNLINAGTYVLEPSVLQRIPSGRRVSIERETFPALVAEGRLFAMGSDAPWLDAGTPGAYLAANLAYAPHGPRSWEGGGEARASVVGEDVTVGPGALVERCVVMDGVQVGEGAVVTDSVLGPGARIGAGARVENLSVIGDEWMVEAGAVLSGARLPAPA